MNETDERAHDFLEQMFRNYILQHWSRERLERFALHLLGDQAQVWWAEQEKTAKDPMNNHKCKKVAQARMGEGREFWLGELTEKIPGHEVETHCLHITTPYKRVVFGIILEDLLVYAAFAHLLHMERFGKPVNVHWLEEIEKNYRRKVLNGFGDSSS